MFGHKQLKTQIETLTSYVTSLREMMEENIQEVKALKKHTDGQISSLEKKLLDIKIDLNKISNKFHSTDEKVERVAKQNDNFDQFFQNQIKTNTEILPMLTLYRSFPDQVQVFIKRQELIFQYLKDVEHIMVNAEAVIENCLPIKSLPKLPKKKTATTTAS